MSDKKGIEKKLVSSLLLEKFAYNTSELAELEECKHISEAYVKVENTIAVLSDFVADRSYIYISNFGSNFGLSPGTMTVESAFEECVFKKVHPDDLIERHILELSYFKFQKQKHVADRRRFSTSCQIRIINTDGIYQYVNHRTLYLKSLQNESIWLALCLYSPAIRTATQSTGIEGKIMDNQTGEVVQYEHYQYYTRKILSKRECEIVQLIGQGLDSKTIATKLNLSVYTIHRHRQNILQKLKVANATEAVQVCLRLGLIRQTGQV